MHVITHLSKAIQCTTPKVNPNINYGLWVNNVVSMKGHQLLTITLVQGCDSGGSYVHIYEG